MNIFQKDLENTSGLFVDQAQDTLDATSTSGTANGRLCDALDVVAEDLAVTLHAALSETLTSKSAAANKTRHPSRTHLSPLSTARHCVMKCFVRGNTKTRFVCSGKPRRDNDYHVTRQTRVRLAFPARRNQANLKTQRE